MNKVYDPLCASGLFGEVKGVIEMSRDLYAVFSEPESDEGFSMELMRVSIISATPSEKGLDKVCPAILLDDGYIDPTTLANFIGFNEGSLLTYEMRCVISSRIRESSIQATESPGELVGTSPM